MNQSAKLEMIEHFILRILCIEKSEKGMKVDRPENSKWLGLGTQLLRLCTVRLVKIGA
jgi:hypothetical protein